jgi:hypothetical protein
LDQNSLAREQLRHPRDDLVQHRLHRFVARRGHFDKLRLTIGTASLNPAEQ